VKRTAHGRERETRPGAGSDEFSRRMEMRKKAEDKKERK
jgi:hypothetical protein